MLMLMLMLRAMLMLHACPDTGIAEQPRCSSVLEAVQRASQGEREKVPPPEQHSVLSTLSPFNTASLQH